MSALSHIRPLRNSLKQAGVFDYPSGAALFKFLAHTILGAALTVACLLLPPVWALLLIPVTGVVWLIAVTMGHEGAHHAAFASGRANDILSSIAFPFMSGMSRLFWRYKHNVLHHRRPNVIGDDEDLEVLPLAVGRAYHLGSSARQQWIQRHLQRGILAWFMVTLLPWDLRVRGLRHLLSYARLRGIDAPWIIDVTLILGHGVAFVVVPAAFVGWLRAFLVYFGIWIVGGAYLGLVGLLGHTAMPLIDTYDDTWELQFFTARNIKLGPVLSWCFVGLDYQIEHHLFPHVSHFRLKSASPIVRRYAEARGLPYREQGLWESLREVTAYLDRAWDDRAMELSSRRLNVAPDRPAWPTWGRLRRTGSTLTKPRASMG